jgi:2-succinyl-5-enolpyruvyl-6-hydroxy-3-cyclohexene-1-carboxylate synthase
MEGLSQTEEADTLERWLARGTPYCEYLLPQSRLAAPDTQRLVDRIATAGDIVCVAGPLAPTRLTAALRRLATHLAAPLFADINSGLRCGGPSAPVLALYNLYLRKAVSQIPPAELMPYFGDRIVSEPLREAEYVVPCLQKTLHVGANRGATGIDGVLSSGIDFGEGLHKSCTVLIGDQALLHDLNAPVFLASTSIPVYVIVINNHSGGIFHFFDLGDTGERLRNPHPWSFRGVAENFHLAYVCPSSIESFVAAYQEAHAQHRSTVFEIVVDDASMA